MSVERRPRGHVFVVACERSGTTSLTSLLQHHPEVVMGMERYRGLLRQVRRTGDPKYFGPSLFEPERFLDCRPQDREGRGLGFAEHYERARRNIEGGAWLYGDKLLPPSMVLIDAVVGAFPSARFIFLHRDPVSVANSFESRARDTQYTNWPPENGHRFGVDHWQRSFNCLDHLLANGNPAQVLPLRVETFFDGQPESLHALLRFLEVDEEPRASDGACPVRDAYLRQCRKAARRGPEPTILSEAEQTWIRSATHGRARPELDERYRRFLHPRVRARTGPSAEGGPTISTVAIPPAAGLGPLRHPSGLTVDPDGHLYVIDSNNHRVLRFGPTGEVTVIAGGNGRGYAGDGDLAVRAQLDLPTAIAIAPDGSLLVADRENDAIRQIDPDGRIHTLAGGNGRGYEGDDGPADRARLFRPRDLTVDATGTIVFTDRDNHAVRSVDPDGVIRTLAGGRCRGGGDGRKATAAGLNRPRGITFGPCGALFVVDRNNHAIRRIDGEGIITTIAGGNGPGWGGDGGLATEAQFDHPSGIAFDRSGTAFVSDHMNNAIRRLDTDGSIATVAGGGPPGRAGDGGPATAAWLSYPSALALGPDGSLFIADRNNNAIRVVEELAAPAHFPSIETVFATSG